MNKFNYFDFLITISRGFNPITGKKFNDNDILLSDDISERLNRLAYELKKDEEIIELKFKNEFNASDICNDIQLTDSIKVNSFATEITKAITNKYPIEIMSLKSVQNKLNNFLFADGKLKKVVTPAGGTKYLASEEGENFGFTNFVEPEASELTRTKVFCSKQAQEYILSKLSLFI